tara:strand:- start:195 stop:443 length:249 start_codon:yes stop_codon:yes gene_type:complete
VLVVTEAVSIASEKVTEMFSLIETPVWLSVGDMEETVGVVVSFSSSLAQEKMVRLKQEIRIMNKTFFIFSSIQKVKYYCSVY